MNPSSSKARRCWGVMTKVIVVVSGLGSYYVITTGEWSVVIDVNTDGMVRVLKDKGYEVKKISD